MSPVRIAAVFSSILFVPALWLPDLHAERRRSTPNVPELAQAARKITIKVPGGHLLGANTDPGYTYAMSDGVPAPKLVVAPGGERYLGYNDALSGARVVALGDDWRIVREIARVDGKRLEDLTADRDGIALLLTEFDAEQKQNYVKRDFHTAHLAKYDARGRALFQKRIVGARKYTKEGDQGIMDSFATFSIAADDDRYATYFTTYRRWSDGVVHQSEYLALFDRKSGQQMMRDDGQSPQGWTWNVSHSFRPRFIHNGKEFVMATVGDAYPRAFIVQFFPGRKRETVVNVPKAQAGETYQYVPVSTGDLYGKDGQSWIVFDSAIGKGDYDIGFVRVDGQSVSQPVWLTGSKRIRERIPRIAPYGTEHLLVLWGVDKSAARDRWFPKLSNIELQAAIVDGQGRLIGGAANFGSSGQFTMRGAARTFALPGGSVGWINDVTGLADQLEVVVIPGPGGSENGDDEQADTSDEDAGEDADDAGDTDDVSDVTINPALNTDLLQAIYDGRESDALGLLQKGADPNASYGQWTALLYAGYFGRTAVVRELIRRRADPNAQVSGWTALRLAEVRGHAQIVEALRSITQVSSRAVGREAVPTVLPSGRGAMQVRSPAMRLDDPDRESGPGARKLLGTPKE